MFRLSRLFLVCFLVCISIFTFGKTRSEQPLRVGLYDNPPKVFVNQSGNADGIFIDILKEIAKKEKFTIQYVYGDWFQLMEQLKNGEIDIVPDVALSEDRDSLYTFHKLYIINSWLEIFTLKEQQINSITDINNLKVGVLKGSIQENYLKESLKYIYNIDYEYIVYNDYTHTIKALKNHEVDVIIANRFLNYADIDEKKMRPTGIILKPSDLYFAFRKDINPDIVEKFDKQIAKLKNDPQSVFYQSLNRWLDRDFKFSIPTYYYWLFAFAFLFGIIILIFNIILQKKVKEKTLELKKINQELLYSKIKAEESDQLKTAFLRNISHEIRTPLNVICGFSNLLTDPQIDRQTIKEYSSTIERSSDQLLHILTDIITISSIESNQELLNYTHFDLDLLMNEVKLFFSKQASVKQITLEFEILESEHGSEIIGDRSKILQVIHHFIHNAIKYTSHGSIRFGYQLKDYEVEFYVKDTGIGISEKQKHRIFERFTHADSEAHIQYGGTGLGLPISKGLVQLMGGKIWVESELNVGSTFYFSIPLMKPEK